MKFSNQLFRVSRILLTSMLLVSAAGLLQPAQPVLAATSYTDSFSSILFTGTRTSFTTGNVDLGLSYTCSGGAGCTFAYSYSLGQGGSGAIRILSNDTNNGTIEKVTITARSGEPFEFVSLWIDPWVTYGEEITLTGYGDEPFSMNVSSAIGTFSPPGGSKLVDRVELTAPEFWYIYLDTVSVVLEAFPRITTNNASGVTAIGATFNGTVNANGASSAVTFEYGLTDSYGTTVTADQSPVTGTSNTAVSKAVSGLTPGTTYHYRVVAVNSAGTTNGEDISFTTNAVPPSVTTDSATSISSDGSILNGTVNANGFTTSVTFQYGLSAAYGSTAAAAQSPVSGATDTAVSYAISGLSPGTTYHYRVAAVNSGGTTNGADMTFTTDAELPSVSTTMASGVTSSGGTLNGTVNANGASTTVTFEYGISDAYGTSVPASPSPVTGTSNTAVSYTVSGLLPGTTYHYRVVAANSEGTTNGENRTFTTSADAPGASTNAATGITANEAVLNGTVNANGDGTTVTFEYGQTTAYGNTVSASPSTVTGTTNTAVSLAISSLPASTTYHYRVVATNSQGTTTGEDRTFVTSDPVYPTAVTNPATDITPTSAILHATINPGGLTTGVPVQYGLTTGYDFTIPADQHPVSGTVDIEVTKTITGLTPGTIYHFRFVAVNSYSTAYGADLTFSTDITAPSVTTTAATDVSSNGGTLNGTVNANGASTTVTIQYGLDTFYGTTVPADQSPVTGSTGTAVSSAISGLTPLTTYHYRVVAVNSEGTTYGADNTFTTVSITDLSISISDNPDPVQIDGSLAYTIIVSNDGSDDSSNVVVTTTLATGAALISTSGCAEDPSGVPTCTLGTISSGASQSLSLSVQAPPASGDITLNASVSSDSDDPDSSNNNSSEVTTVDGGSPTTMSINIQTDIGAEVFVNGSSTSAGITGIIVSFSEDVQSAGGPDSADNPANYLLFSDGGDGFETTSCAAGIDAGDLSFATGPVLYDNNGGAGPFEVAVTVNNLAPLPPGSYRLLVCGTTSIYDLAGNILSGDTGPGSDYSFSFSVLSERIVLPATGFAPREGTQLPQQPVEKSYSNPDSFWLDIPSLGVVSNIVGIPQLADGWDVTWLGQDVGYLYGTAYPTWPGNTTLTGHVIDESGLAGPFVNLASLRWGDQLLIHTRDMDYVYEVRSISLWTSPEDTSAITRHEEYDWLTLITCRGYDEAGDRYRFRTVVRAVLVAVE